MALTLLEYIHKSGLDFVFKGGTSLILLFKTSWSIFIDIDIPPQNDRDVATLPILK